MLETYTRFILTSHRWVIAFCIISIIVLANGAHKLTIGSNLRIYFDQDNPQVVMLDQLEEQFFQQDYLAFYIQVNNEQTDIFNPSMLTLLAKLTEQSWQIPHSQRVTSLANYQYIDVAGDQLDINPLAMEPDKFTASAIGEIKRKVLSNSFLVPKLISPDGRATLVIVTLNLPKTDSADTGLASVNFARNLQQQWQQKYPKITLYLAGSATFNVVMGEAIQTDLATLAGISFGAILTGLWLLLSNFWGMLLIVIVISSSVVIALGGFGWLGGMLSPVSGFVPTAVMTIAVADCVHILISYYYELAQGKIKQQAISEALRINATPIFITSMTTMVGVLCLNFNESPPYRDLGNVVALGVFAAYLLTMTLLPALLMILPAKGGKTRWITSHGMGHMATWIIAHQRLLLWLVGGTIVIMASQVGRNKFTERWHEYFDDSFEVRRATEAINEHLGGVHNLSYIINSGHKDGINDPAFLQAVDQFAEWFRQQEGVVNVDSLVDTIKLLNQKFHQDQVENYRVPQQQDLSAQLLLLYELSLPQGLGLDNQVTYDRSALLLKVSLKKTNSERLLALEDQAQNWLKQHQPQLTISPATGLDIVFAKFMHNNIRSLLLGTGLALVLISMLLIFSLQSWRMGLISLIPNLIPAIIAYGIWGITVGYIGNANAVVACISLGLIVDDTVHFLSKYLRAKREQGLQTAEAIHYAFNTVGVALCITSIALISGFLVMLASHFNPSREMGVLLSMTVGFALAIDLLFLPPMLLLLDRHH